jgi:hypothetical protein
VIYRFARYGTLTSLALDADYRPLGLATRHFFEAGLVVHGFGPEPHVGRSPAAARDRASLALEDRFEVGDLLGLE